MNMAIVQNMKRGHIILTTKGSALPIIIFGLALIVAIATIFLNRLFITIICIFISVFSLLWLKYYKDAEILSTENATFCDSSKLIKIFTTIFFVCYTISIILIYKSNNLYQRPIEFFIIISLLAGLLSFQCLYIRLSKGILTIVFIEIILLALMVSFSQQLVFPDVVETDPWYHKLFTLTTIQEGHLPSNMQYSSMPLFHILSTSCILTTDLGYRDATLFTTGLVQIVIIGLVIVSIGRKILGIARVGLIAALLTLLADRFLWMNYTIIPNTLGIVFITVIIYLLITNRINRSLESSLLTLILMLALILTHTLSAMVLIVFLFTVVMIQIILPKINRYFSEWRYKPDRASTFSLFLLISTGAFAYWSYVSRDISTLADFFKSGFSTELNTWFQPIDVKLYSLRIPFTELLLDSIFEYVFFSLSIIGLFYVTKKGERSVMLEITLAGLVLLFLTYLSSFGVWLMQYRWILFDIILLSIPIAIGIIFLSKISSKITYKLVFSSLISLLILSSITNSAGSLDNFSFRDDINSNVAMKTSDLASLNTLMTIVDGNISVDQYAYRILYYEHPKDRSRISDASWCLYDKIFSPDELIIIRESIVDQSFRMFSTTYKLDYNPNVLLTSENWNRIYSSSSTNCYVT